MYHKIERTEVGRVWLVIKVPSKRFINFLIDNELSLTTNAIQFMM